MFLAGYVDSLEHVRLVLYKSGFAVSQSYGGKVFMDEAKLSLAIALLRGSFSIEVSLFVDKFETPISSNAHESPDVKVQDELKCA